MRIKRTISVALFGFLAIFVAFSGCTKNRSAAPENSKSKQTPVLRKNPYASQKKQSSKAVKNEKPKLCLNMIVKNEKDVIRRCLDSVIPIIDYWVILDTGSTDGTQDIIQKHLQNIPGELYESPWKTWGKSRTEAFNLAKGKGEYILFMDADDILSFDNTSWLSKLKTDQYRLWRGSNHFLYEKPQIVKGDLPWRWVGVTHEYLDCPVPYNSELLTDVKYVTLDGGAGSKDPKKFAKNVALLKDGIKEEPENSRYAFYLAESYRDSGKKAKALEWFQKRVDMGGWAEEVFWSKLQIGHMLRELNCSDNLAIEAYKDAFVYRPHRPESIYFIAELCNSIGRYAEAYMYLKTYQQIKKPDQKDALFNMQWIADYGLTFQLSICSYYVGNYQEALDTCDQLLANENLPESWRKLTEKNRTFPLNAMADKALNEPKP